MKPISWKFVGRPFLFAALLATGCGSESGPGTTAPPPMRVPLEKAELFIETNFADGDAEVVVTASGGDLPIAQLEMIDPSGRRILAVTSTDPTSLGLADLEFETPEPDLDAAFAAYPEGRYRFLAEATDGTLLEGEVDLVHQVPEPARIEFPEEEDALDVAGGLVASWVPSPEAVAQSIEVDNEDLEIALGADLGAAATTFDVPSSWITNGVEEYAFAVETIAQNGNRSVTEVAFTTAGESEGEPEEEGEVPEEEEPPEFEAALYIERIEIDNDAQVFVVADAGVGLSRLEVVGPDGSARLVVEIDDVAGLGMRKFEFATPEPLLEDLFLAYPAGAYPFVATTASGASVAASAELSHDLVAVPEVLEPSLGSTVDVSDGLLVDWSPVPGAVAYAVGIEDEEIEDALDAELPGDATEFLVPATWILPGVEEYVLDVNAIGANGNQIVTEVRFGTAE